MSINRERLLSVVNANWEPYTKMQHVRVNNVFDGEESPLQSYDVPVTDFDLLRHDIHVLLHESREQIDG